MSEFTNFSYYFNIFLMTVFIEVYPKIVPTLLTFILNNFKIMKIYHLMQKFNFNFYHVGT